MKTALLIVLTLTLTSCGPKLTPEQQAQLAADSANVYIKNLTPEDCYFSDVHGKWFCFDDTVQEQCNASGITKEWIRQRITSNGLMHGQQDTQALLKLYGCYSQTRKIIHCKVPLNDYLVEFFDLLTRKNDDGTYTYERI